MTKNVGMVTIKGFPDYSITEQGVVYSTKRGGLVELKGNVGSSGYRKVSLRNGKQAKTESVHRLVAAAFLKKPRGFNIVNHIDGVKTNNAVSNLEWTNHYGNSKHYGETLAPAYKVKRDKKEQDKIKTNLTVAKFAFDAFKDDPESFQKVFEAIFLNQPCLDNKSKV